MGEGVKQPDRFGVEQSAVLLGARPFYPPPPLKWPGQFGVKWTQGGLKWTGCHFTQKRTVAILEKNGIKVRPSGTSERHL